MESPICFISTKINNNIKNRIKCLTELKFVKLKGDIKNYKKHLQAIGYEIDFFVIWDERTDQDMSFSIVDISSEKYFRCEIDALNYPVDGLFTATSDFDMFYQSEYDVYPAIISPVKELKPQPAKRLPRRT